MNRLIFFICFLATMQLYGQQDINGPWHGILNIQGTQLRLTFNIKTIDGNLSATMDSPDQGAKGIPVSDISYQKNLLKISVNNAGINYEGTLSDDGIIRGSFKQATYKSPMDLTRQEQVKKGQSKPQDPIKPYPYLSEDLTFENEKAGITLSATLSLPNEKGPHPAVILISGSGPQNRDSELLGHRPFLVLSDFLCRNGIAVLRYDDRGTGASTGNFQAATSMDFAQDVEAGIKYLLSRKEINHRKIGLIGHSEGGLIAPIVASNSNDVAFIVLLAGPGLPGDQILLLQQELILMADGASAADIAKTKNDNAKAFKIISKTHNDKKLEKQLTKHFNKIIDNDPNPKFQDGITKEKFVKLQVDQLTSPWMRYFISYDPRPTLQKVKCPVFAINGEKDLQVPPRENLKAIEIALAKGNNKKYHTKEMPGLNHLFQECKTGAPAEYASIEQTFSPTALKEILMWMSSIVK
jgi:fermentation-respiration switch protein FrsA (DUF1100 family)